jgi:hypothetical protein
MTIKPEHVRFSEASASWVLDLNYNEKVAKLKNSRQGISLSVMHLFKMTGSPLAKPVKLPFATGLEPSAAASDSGSQACGLQALLDRPKMLPLMDGKTDGSEPKKLTLDSTAGPAHAAVAGPPAALPVAARATRSGTSNSSNAPLQLQIGVDGRVRALPAKRSAVETEPSVHTPTRSRRRLGRKTTVEELLPKEDSADKDLAAPAVAETQGDQNIIEALPATPSPVPTEVAEERSPSLELLGPDGVETPAHTGLLESSQAAPDSQEEAL